jgi:hypothetical protein
MTASGKSVFTYGAGNQAEALKASNFNSYYRQVVLSKLQNPGGVMGID